jgi:hypothetical protein
MPPDLPPVYRPASRTFNASKEAVWQAAAIALADWHIERSDKDTGTIYVAHRLTKTSFEKWATAPVADNFIRYQGTQFSVIVTETEGGRASATIRAQFWTTIVIGYQVENRNAESKGVFENYMLDNIEKALTERTVAQ